MKIKKLFSCLLAVILICCSALTGCSDKGNMFSDMKKISQIKSSEFTSEGGITIQSDEMDLQFHFTLDGKTDGKSAAMNCTFTSGALTLTLDDFIRMTDNTVYINMAPIFSTLFGLEDTESMEGMKSWVSSSVSVSDDTAAISQSFNETMIDAFERLCKDQDISKSGDTWTLNIPGDKMASFALAALNEIDTNLSSWYDLYVKLLEKTGTGELLSEYSALSGEETEEDAVQALKNGKEEALNSWKETSTSLKEQLNGLEEAISSGKVSTSGKLEVSLAGKEGARKAGETVSFSYEDTSDSTSISLDLDHKLTEAGEVTVEAPDAADVMTMEEYMDLMSGMFVSYDDDYYDTVLSEAEEEAILSTLKEDQLYMYYGDDLIPHMITFDPAVYTADQQIGDYIDLNIAGTEASYATLVYDSGNLEQDLKDYYLDESAQTSTMSTGAGEVIWYTASEPDEWDSYVTTFGIQLDDKAYLIGFLNIDKNEKVDVETCIKGLLKEVTPCETSPSSEV